MFSEKIWEEIKQNQKFKFACEFKDKEIEELREENEIFQKFTDKIIKIIKYEKENGCKECETRNDGNCDKCPIGKIEKLILIPIKEV